MPKLKTAELDIFVKADRHPRQLLKVISITVEDQGVSPLRDARQFTLELSRRAMPMLQSLTNHSKLVMHVVDKGRPSIKWVFHCAIDNVRLVATMPGKRPKQVARARVCVHQKQTPQDYYLAR